MGDAADDLYHWELCHEFKHKEDLEFEYKIERYAIDNINKKYSNNILTWTTIDKRNILIQEMTSNHITNCIKMLEREGLNPIRSCWVDVFNYELKKRIDAKKD